MPILPPVTAVFLVLLLPSRALAWDIQQIATNVGRHNDIELVAPNTIHLAFTTNTNPPHIMIGNASPPYAQWDFVDFGPGDNPRLGWFLSHLYILYRLGNTLRLARPATAPCSGCSACGPNGTWLCQTIDTGLTSMDDQWELDGMVDLRMVWEKPDGVRRAVLYTSVTYYSSVLEGAPSQEASLGAVVGTINGEARVEPSTGVPHVPLCDSTVVLADYTQSRSTSVGEKALAGQYYAWKIYSPGGGYWTCLQFTNYAVSYPQRPSLAARKAPGAVYEKVVVGFGNASGLAVSQLNYLTGFNESNIWFGVVGRVSAEIDFSQKAVIFFHDRVNGVLRRAYE